MTMKRNTIVKGGRTKRPATRLLKEGRSCTPSYTSPLTEEILSTPPPTIDDASPRSANDHHLVVTLPLRGRSKGTGLNGNQEDIGTIQSRIPYRPVSSNGPKDDDMHGEGSRRMSQCADRGLHKSGAARQVTRTKGLLEQAAPDQSKDRLDRKSSTASTGTKEDFNLEETSPSSTKIAQESQRSLAPTPSLPGHVSKRSSRPSKSRRRKQLGQQSLSSGLESLAYSSTAVYRIPCEPDLLTLATPPPGRFQRSERLSPRVLRPPHGSMDRSSPFAGLSRHSTLPASSNSRVASRVSKEPSSAGIRSLRSNQRTRRRFSIERCLKLVPEAHSSTYDTRAQRFSIAEENTDMLLKAAMNYAYRYLRSNEPNLPDITLDGLEAIVNDLVHTINDKDPSREIRIRGGRLGGQLLDSALARGLEGYTIPCGQDAEFDPVVQLPAWHAT